MKTRTLSHRRKLKNWITSIVAITSVILFTWWFDKTDTPFITEFAEWLIVLHFFIRLSVMMIYFLIVFVIIHFYWELIKWIVGKLVDKFY